MERIVDVHVRHDFVAVFQFVIGHAIGGDLGQTQMRFRIDQAGINRHAGYVNHLRTAGDGRTCATDGGDPSVLHHDYTVFNDAMGNGQQLAAAKGNGLSGVLGNSSGLFGLCLRQHDCCNSEKNDPFPEHDYWPSLVWVKPSPANERSKNTSPSISTLSMIAADESG